MSSDADRRRQEAQAKRDAYNAEKQRLAKLAEEKANEAEKNKKTK